MCDDEANQRRGQNMGPKLIIYDEKKRRPMHQRKGFNAPQAPPTSSHGGVPCDKIFMHRMESRNTVEM
jgi:hypothetical protein